MEGGSDEVEISQHENDNMQDQTQPVNLKQHNLRKIKKEMQHQNKNEIQLGSPLPVIYETTHIGSFAKKDGRVPKR